MQFKANWFLALILGGLFVVPAVAEGQPKPVHHRIRPTKPQTAPPPPTSTGSTTVQFSGGGFLMGSNEGDPDAKPSHQASVAPFKMMAREVTTAEYKQCVDANKCTAAGSSASCNWGQPGKENHPINCVDFYQATNYCTYVGMRLPTEQEWEFAAKHPDNRIYPWGPDVPDGRACWKQSSTCSVGSFPTGKSKDGVLDLSGNVAEWTASPFCPYQSGGCTATERAVRGGGWSLAVATEIQTSSRAGFNKGVRSATIGFRCVGDPAAQ